MPVGVGVGEVLHLDHRLSPRAAGGDLLGRVLLGVRRQAARARAERAGVSGIAAGQHGLVHALPPLVGAQEEGGDHVPRHPRPPTERPPRSPPRAHRAPRVAGAHQPPRLVDQDVEVAVHQEDHGGEDGRQAERPRGTHHRDHVGRGPKPHRHQHREPGARQDRGQAQETRIGEGQPPAEQVPGPHGVPVDAPGRAERCEEHKGERDQRPARHRPGRHARGKHHAQPGQEVRHVERPAPGGGHVDQ